MAREAKELARQRAELEAALAAERGTAQAHGYTPTPLATPKPKVSFYSSSTLCSLFSKSLRPATINHAVFCFYYDASSPLIGINNTQTGIVTSLQFHFASALA